MPRTTADLVEGIIEVDPDIVLDPFIDAANLLVNRICLPAKNADGTPYYTDDTELEMIERWLSAHFYQVRDPFVATEQAGPVLTRFESSVSLNLQMTRFGQQALILDTSGRLAVFNKQVTTGSRRSLWIKWLGSDPPNDEDVLL